MTPLLTALSSLRLALWSSLRILSLSPDSAASRKRRTAVFSDDLMDWLRSRAFSLVRIRLSCDLMLATRIPSISPSGGVPSRGTTPDRNRPSPGHPNARQVMPWCCLAATQRNRYDGTMEVLSSRILLRPRDRARSTAFYRDILGLA